MKHFVVLGVRGEGGVGIEDMWNTSWSWELEGRGGGVGIKDMWNTSWSCE